MRLKHLLSCRRCRWLCWGTSGAVFDPNQPGPSCAGGSTALSHNPCGLAGFIDIGAFDSDDKQTCSVSEYDTSQHFTGVNDVSVLSHEVAEWLDDPYVNNATPPWGHIGQVSGCQNNLETGDPLSGKLYPVTIGGVVYHPQELAYFSWFFNERPSVAKNGLYSNKGTFTSPAPLWS